MNWDDTPDMDRVQKVFLEIGRIKAKIRLLKFDIDLAAIEVKKDTPRKPHLVLEATQDIQRELAELEARLAELELEKEFLNYHKDMWRQYGYNNR